MQIVAIDVLLHIIDDEVEVRVDEKNDGIVITDGDEVDVNE